MSQLTFAYEYDRSWFDGSEVQDHFGRLTMTVSTDRFCGKGEFWVQWQDVKAFGESLATYPISPERPISDRWGYNKCEGDGLIFGVKISPADIRGNLRTEVEIADQHEPRMRVRAIFQTNYPQLEAFRVSIGQLMRREVAEAILIGR
ncbi:MAG TPA: hypothetical protein VF481_01340 [Novosphingobium sp.]